MVRQKNRWILVQLDFESEVLSRCFVENPSSNSNNTNGTKKRKLGTGIISESSSNPNEISGKDVYLALNEILTQSFGLVGAATTEVQGDFHFVQPLSTLPTLRDDLHSKTVHLNSIHCISSTLRPKGPFGNHQNIPWKIFTRPILSHLPLANKTRTCDSHYYCRERLGTNGAECSVEGSKETIFFRSWWCRWYGWLWGREMVEEIKSGCGEEIVGVGGSFGENWFWLLMLFTRFLVRLWRRRGRTDILCNNYLLHNEWKRNIRGNRKWRWDQTVGSLEQIYILCLRVRRWNREKQTACLQFKTMQTFYVLTFA